MNNYRSASGDAMVSENSDWTAGILAHLQYLAKTPQSLMTGDYANAHTENPASPWYTDPGAEEGASSDLTSGATSDVSAIDRWLEAPFHAIGILRPGLRQVAFARDRSTERAGLDVISGLDYSVTQETPVLFPGPNMTTPLSSFGGESPSPLETCHWTSGGLPLIALLPADPSPSIEASLTGPSGAATTCVVTASDYVTTDSVYGETGREILAGDHAVLVIPKSPLRNGRWTASLTQTGGADITWSFTVKAPTAPPKHAGGSGISSSGGAKRECRVPRIVRVPLVVARKLLQLGGCSVGSVTQAWSALPRGLVVASRPAAGRVLRYRAKVALTISRGPKHKV